MLDLPGHTPMPASLTGSFVVVGSLQLAALQQLQLLPLPNFLFLGPAPRLIPAEARSGLVFVKQ